MSEPFPILDRLVDDGRVYQMSARELRMFFNDLEVYGSHQILVSRSKGAKVDTVKIFVTYEKMG